tara:strand:+ start:405 stop:800 length:396 start_codon:yes stop_codon:yes gene_type:complete
VVLAEVVLELELIQQQKEQVEVELLVKEMTEEQVAQVLNMLVVAVEVLVQLALMLERVLLELVEQEVLLLLYQVQFLLVVAVEVLEKVAVLLQVDQAVVQLDKTLDQILELQDLLTQVAAVAAVVLLVVDK